ncbi:SAM-dependent methyltransferase [Streptomyces sp. Tu102]|uniref:SAM-dependent methyltransferase n=1 Tax=Streptomyces sp. Tu102 TaxID=2838019 RepID=UPI001BDBCC4B|nr:SAM-dependent methyltransferase [Streptomyces sp. Tu102]MBT1095736.1 hypothetical protein [Streptomyces sp. Tu102]
MSSGGLEALDRHYKSVQAGWKVEDRSPSYGKLVVPVGNADEPLYRWFHLKEAFSSRLLGQLLKDADIPLGSDLSVADPFAGSGTSLVSAISLSAEMGGKARVFGVERNPFIWELAQAKLQARLGGSSLVTPLAEQLENVVRIFEETRGADVEVPRQSTLSNKTYFPAQNVETLIRIRHAIEGAAESEVRSILRICLASCVEAAGRLRRDGRALRYEKSREPRDPWPLFHERVDMVRQDLAATKPAECDGLVALGDARDFGDLAAGRIFDLIVFSPPYPNNIDYTEVYKTESWILGCYANDSDMKAQRQATIRSHPSVRFSRELAYMKAGFADQVTALVNPILSHVPQGDRYYEGRKEVIEGYADDMLRVLAECRRNVSEVGRLVFVVGNSLHGSGESKYVIAADVIMARLAELCGWRVVEIRVARKLKRRFAESEFLRESVVVLAPA